MYVYQFIVHDKYDKIEWNDVLLSKVSVVFGFVNEIETENVYLFTVFENFLDWKNEIV